MNKFLTLLLLSVFAFANIADKNKLKIYKKEKVSLSIRLNDVAKKIIKENIKIKKLKTKIKKLTKSIKSQEKKHSFKLKRLDGLVKSVASLTTEQAEIQERLNDLIAKQFSISIISQNSKIPDAKILVEEKILSNLQKMIKENFIKLQNRFLTNKKVMTRQMKDIENIQTNIKKLKNEKSNLTTLKLKHSESLTLFSNQKKRYKAEILKISKEQNAIRLTLRKLKIIKEVEIPQNRAKPIIVTHVKDVKVRKIGSSYRVSKVKKYRGNKTIPPLKEYEIIRKFGTYHDPIYKIKLFSESVKLRAKIPDAKVRSVLEGKIVYAQSTKVLGKVVIIKTNQMNVIYGHLSQIPPNIKVGKVVKKGSVIGRVKRDLIFEVTNKNVHINPLALIS